MSWNKMKQMEERRLRKTKRVREVTKRKAHIPSVYARRRRKK